MQTTADVMRSLLDDPDPLVRTHARNRLAALAAEGVGPPAYPSLARRALNFAGAVASHVAAGLAEVDDAEHARRLGICRGCPSYDADADGCRECGCRMEVKARWASQACPLGLWGEGGPAAPPP